MSNWRTRPPSGDAPHVLGLRHPDEAGVSSPRTSERILPDLPTGNVVPFAPSRASLASTLHAHQEARPALVGAAAGFGFSFGLGLTPVLAASLLAHAALIYWILGTSQPVVGVGETVVAVEVVMGSQMTAGDTDAVTPADTQNAETRDSPAVEIAAQASDADQGTSPVRDQADVPPRPAASTMSTPAPNAVPMPPVRQAKAAPERKRAQPAPERLAQSIDSSQVGGRPAASAASSGVGAGVSDADASHRNLVAAHLTRHKQYPPESRARGEQGWTRVAFTIDGAGNVLNVALSGSSGVASFERETEAMVRRASPFPPPPSGTPMSFVVPVNFTIH